ncbi:predicted protein [Verticillium alfalfae VaMs.102]|uniref:Predicted protein n=1 Tax=Verticillium alfalfae (strain VaMs.102 / ATCC MYA-4576 / FGSC 10136) TaxID=526221 RepID=C9SR09_VERA1|nr:predicted protein [Verticillium alfalfae VaMs.102]EEY21284.1 predicted protein [Verticillium alfalfae VaMs.102]
MPPARRKVEVELGAADGKQALPRRSTPPTIRVKGVRQRLGGAADEGKALPGRVSVLGLLAATAHYAYCTFPLKSKTTTPPALRPSQLAAGPRPPIPRGKNASPHPLDPPLPHMTCPNANQWQQA